MNFTNNIFTINNGFLEADANIFFRSSVLNNSKASILLIHGFAEHSARYAYVTHALNKAGFNVYAFDLAGHGLSGYTKGFIKNINDYIKNVDNMIELISKNHPQQKIGILGHSMGGLIALYAMQKNYKNLYSAVLSNPLLKIKATPGIFKHYLANTLALINPYLRLASTVKTEYLSNNEKSNQEYQNDKLILKSVCIGWYRQICLALSKVKHIKPSVATLVQLSAYDEVIDSDYAQIWFNNLTDKQHLLNIYQNARHELYHELQRDLYIQDMIAWFVNHL